MESLLILFKSGIGSFISVAYFNALSCKTKVDQNSVWKIYLGLFVSLLFIFYIENYAGRLLAVTLLIFALSYLFHASNGARIFFVGTFIAVCNLASVFSTIVFHTLSGLGFMFMTEYTSLFSACFAYVLLYSFIKFIEGRGIKANVSNILNNSVSIIFLISIVLIVSIQVIICYTFDFKDELSLIQALVILIILVIFWLNNLSIFVAMSYKTAFILEKDVKDEAYRNLDLQRKYYSELLDQHRHSYKKVHDFKNKLQVVILALRLSKKDFALRKLEELAGDTFSTEGFVKTGNKVIDAIFGSKKTKLNDSGTELKVYSNIESEIHMNDFDLAVIIGNAIDNAIEACLKLPTIERYIEVEIEESDDQLIFIFTNPTIENLLIVENTIQTSKRDGKHLHGFGLENIQGAARKYNGYSIVRCEDGFFELTVKLQTGVPAVK